MEKNKSKITIVGVILLVLIIILVASYKVSSMLDSKKGREEQKKHQLILNEYAEAALLKANDYISSHDGEVPLFEDIRDDVQFSDHNIDCITSKINYDGSVYLELCKIDKSVYNYSYGKDLKITDTSKPHTYKYNIDIQKYVELEKSEKEYKHYKIDIVKAYKDNLIDTLSSIEDYNLQFRYKIDDNVITLKLMNGSTSYKVYLNNKYIYDVNVSWDSEVNVIGKYIIFRKSGPDTRSLHLYVVDTEGDINELYELDSVNGMRGTDFTFDGEKLIIEGSRITHGPSVEYDKMYSLMSEFERNEALSKLSSDLVVKATYTYKYLNGVLQTNPEISNKVTLGEYLSSLQ